MLISWGDHLLRYCANRQTHIFRHKNIIVPSSLSVCKNYWEKIKIKACNICHLVLWHWVVLRVLVVRAARASLWEMSALRVNTTAVHHWIYAYRRPVARRHFLSFFFNPPGFFLGIHIHSSSFVCLILQWWHESWDADEVGGRMCL